VELSGTGELLPGEPILAPLTGTRCTWYRYSVQERRRWTDDEGGGPADWEEIEGGVSPHLFLLVDDTGQCVIDPDGAAVTPSATDTWCGQTRRPGPAPRGRWRFGTGRYRYREERMHPGDPLYVIGELRTQDGAADPVDPGQEAAALMGAWKRDPQRMRELDRNRDGQVDAQEWATAREDALGQVREARAWRAASPGVPVVGRPRQPARPYLLSSLPQERMARRYRWRARLALGFFFAAGIGLVWIVGARLGA
jgi:hypothetical protein